MGKNYTIKDLNYNIEVNGQNTHLSLLTKDVKKARSLFSLFIPYLYWGTEH